MTSLRTRAAKLFGRDKKENAVRVGRIDQAVFSDLRQRAPRLNEALDPPTLPNGEQLDSRVWEKLAEDVFSAHYGVDEPSLHARERIDERFHVNRAVDDKIIREEGFTERRAMTQGQRPESMMALLGHLSSMAESYGEELGKHGELQNEIAKQQDELEDVDDYLEHLRQLRNDGDPGGMTTEEIDERIRRAADRKRGAVDALREAQHQAVAQAGDLVNASRKAAAKAAEKSDELVEIASLTPGKSDGPGVRTSPELMLALLERIERNPSLRRALELLGRVEIAMREMRSKLRKGGFEEMVDIETGDDLRNVLIGEKALLGHPVAKLDFYRRFLDRTLMQYDIWSESDQKKGPLIIATDGSDSMSIAERNAFARAIAMGAIDICHGERRNCAALEFGSLNELAEFWFPAGRPLDTGTLLDFAEHFFRGGTDINQVLVRAKELIDNEAPFYSADLVIVTDGGDYVTSQTIELRDALRAMNVRIHGIAIGIEPTDYLVTVCDAISSVFDYAGPNPATDRLAIDLT